jgi:5-methylcytosine-specific restriction endonuclease McrA
MGKRANEAKFSTKVRNIIIERDEGLCVRCKRAAQHIHHVIFRSQMGKGTIDNGVCVCHKCHEWAHMSKEGRLWFEEYRENNLCQ